MNWKFTLLVGVVTHRAGHASALMGLTVVGICAGSLEDGLDGLALQMMP
jgi:hypothetical protein